MENSSSDLRNESQKNTQSQQPPTDVVEPSSEIEKLYLKIKEDWL
tara:strand:+ start:239 stop:373 length:135 start_codon:yes stop_codon:yes gene_type:complete